MENSTDNKSDNSENAIVIDLGRKKKKSVKALCRGTGKLLDEVHDCLDELRNAGEINGDVRPVIVVVREKARAPRWF